MATTFTVLEVAEHIDRQVRERWDRQFWVRGEVSGLKRSARSAWFDLVQTDADGRVLAQLSVSMPASKARLVDRRLRAVGQPLADGLELRIKAQLSFWVPSGRLTLQLADVDPTHTAGALAIARQQLLAAMAADGSATRNAALPRPRLPQRLGLVTSVGSQAYHDLIDELRRAGFAFEVQVASARVQGPHAPAEIVAALRRLTAGVPPDVLMLTRGGGADIDLVTFDHPDVARAVAECPVPVWTGIGHHLDSPVAELVAAEAFKTPTALAQGVVAAVAAAVDATETLWAAIQHATGRRLAAAERNLVAASQRTKAARATLTVAGNRLDAAQHRLAEAATRTVRVRHRRAGEQRGRLLRAAPHVLVTRHGHLDRAARLVELADPARLLARGWSVTTTTDGHLVTEPQPIGTRLRTITAGGTLTSEVIDDDG